VIVFEWEEPPGAQPKPEAFAIDWGKFSALTTDPGAATPNALAVKAVAIKDVKALQVLLLMWATAPEALLGLDYQRQGFAALPLSNEPVPVLDQLTTLIQSPLRIGLSFHPQGLPGLAGVDFDTLQQVHFADRPAGAAVLRESKAVLTKHSADKTGGSSCG